MGFLLIFVLVLLFGAKKFMEVGFFFVGLMWGNFRVSHIFFFFMKALFEWILLP